MTGIVSLLHAVEREKGGGGGERGEERGEVRRGEEADSLHSIHT